MDNTVSEVLANLIQHGKHGHIGLTSAYVNEVFEKKARDDDVGSKETSGCTHEHILVRPIRRVEHFRLQTVESLDSLEGHLCILIKFCDGHQVFFALIPCFRWRAIHFLSILGKVVTGRNFGAIKITDGTCFWVRTEPAGS